MPTTKDDSRLLEFWGGPRDGERITLAEFIKSYPRSIASFPIPGSSRLYVYKANLESDSGKVVYAGEMTADEAAKLSSN